ncbi:MAG: metallophosphoesterase family protein [Thermoguttaceae bacterium]
MPGRLIAIGDIHGCLAALQTLLTAIDPGPKDTIVAMGDYGDRGPDTCGVLEELCRLAGRTRLVPLLGNHDEMMLKVCRGRSDLFSDWLAFGGDATLASYHALLPEGVWPRHLDFLEGCRLYYETPRHFFVHASYRSDLALARQPRDVLVWESLKRGLPGPHVSGKIAIVGHTSQKTGEILDLGHLLCIDTWCYGEGWLTALEVAGGRLWQANKTGRLRQGPQPRMKHG